MASYLIRCVAAGAFAAALSGLSANAAELKKPANFPTRAISVFVCVGAGGGSDVAMRALATPLEKIIGVPVQIVNKPGAGGISCLPDFNQAPPDGYTLLNHFDNVSSKYVSGENKFHPANDFVPLMIMNVVPSQIYIRSKDERFLTNGKGDIRKVVEYAKAAPGKLTVSNFNSFMERGSMSLVEKHFGFSSRQVFYDKPAERYGAVLGGKLDVLFEQPSDVLQYIQAGELQAVLTIWPTRFAMFPDTPALGADFGVKFKPLLRWRGMFARKGTPKEITDYLEAALTQAWHGAEYQAYIKKNSLDIVPSFMPSKEMRDVIEAEIVAYRDLYKSLGLKVRDGL